MSGKNDQSRTPSCEIGGFPTWPGLSWLATLSSHLPGNKHPGKCPKCPSNPLCSCPPLHYGHAGTHSSGARGHFALSKPHFNYPPMAVFPVSCPFPTVRGRPVRLCFLLVLVCLLIGVVGGQASPVSQAGDSACKALLAPSFCLVLPCLALSCLVRAAGVSGNRSAMRGCQCVAPAVCRKSLATTGSPSPASQPMCK